MPLNPIAPNSDEVVLSVTDAKAAEDGTDQALAFTVTRLGSTASDLTVNYAVGGTATAGSDYTALPGSVIIPAGSSSAEILATVLADSELEQPETVTLTLAAGAGYVSGISISGTGVITDALSTLPTTTVVFQEGLNGYTGQFQKRVGYSTSSGVYTAQLGSSVASYSMDGGDPDINDLIRFDYIIGAGGIPSGAKVLKAELILTTSASTDAQSGGPFIVDRLISAVDQSTTYDSISYGQGFEGVRGISTGLPAAGFPALAQGEAGAADVTDIVRTWVVRRGEPRFRPLLRWHDRRFELRDGWELQSFPASETRRDLHQPADPRIHLSDGSVGTDQQHAGLQHAGWSHARDGVHRPGDQRHPGSADAVPGGVRGPRRRSDPT